MSSVILHNGTVPVSNGRALSNDAFVADVNDITGETDKTPSEVASTLSDINDALGAAITAKGGTVASDSTLSDKVEEVGSIPGGGGDPYEKANGIITTTIVYFKSAAAGRLLNGSADFTQQARLKSLVFYSQKNAIQEVQNTIWGADSIQYFNAGLCSSTRRDCFGYCPKLKTIILRSRSVATAWNSSMFPSTPNAIVYVPDIDDMGDDLPAKYKEATNWTSSASRIKGYSESQVYDAVTEYGIGDVCQYNGKFYGYCKEDLQPATGHAPSGTAEDNEYWEYIDDIEVSA